MCGRFAITLSPDEMRRLFAYREQPNFPPRYNIAPTQPIPIVSAKRDDHGVSRHFALMRWAFLPGFVKDPKTFALIFNARSESIEEKASFKNAIRRRRCLVPADCFYEWHRTGAGRTAASQAYLARRTDGDMLALAGIWETWMGPNGEEVDTACIVTTAANQLSAQIHPRLPAVIERDDFAIWLDPDESRTEEAIRLLRPAGEKVLQFVPIGDAVNKVANEGPEVQTPVGPPLSDAPNPPPPDAQPSLF